ncbi:protein LBH [Perca flavescens]|nr:LBH domain-containing protein 2 [Perca flavescens]
MTEVMNSLEPGTEDFSGGGAGADQAAIFPDTHERYPKLSKRLPSIVVEPMDGAEVESGELRWPPDEPSSPDGQTERPSADEQTERQSADEQTERQSADEQTERQSADEQTADEDQSNVDADQEASGAEIQDSN